MLQRSCHDLCAQHHNTLGQVRCAVTSNRVCRQSGFLMFINIMAQRHYVRMSAMCYRCGEQSHQGENICGVSMVSLMARWPIFWPVFDLWTCSWTANPYYLVVQWSPSVVKCHCKMAFVQGRP